jgi:hypothetical protein
VCDLETSRIGAPYIYDISNLRVKAKIIPVIIGATGTVSKSLRQYRSIITGKHETKEITRTAIMGTAHTFESANVKVQNIFHMRNNIICSTNCEYRRAAKLYTLETRFLSII